MHKDCNNAYVVSDQHTGDVICSECGFVCDVQLTINDLGNRTTHEENNIIFQRSLSEQHMTIVDICTNANLPTRYAHESYANYNKTLKRLFKDARVKEMFNSETHTKNEVKQLSKTTLRREPKYNILILCLYETLILNNAPHTLKELCALTNTCLMTLCDYHKLYFPCSPPILASALVLRMSAKIGYNRAEIVKFEREVISHQRKNQTQDYRPSTVIAALLWKNSKQRSKTKKLDLETICEVCGVSKSSIERYLKKFPR